MPTNEVARSGWQASSAACTGCAGASRIDCTEPDLDGLAGIDHAQVVAQLGDHAEIVRHEQQRDVELGDQLAQQQQDLVLRRDVERGGRLVGDHQLRRTGERRGDQQALALAARELMRIASRARSPDRHLHAAEQHDQPRDVVAPRPGACQRMRLEHLGADLEHRIEREQRILRDEADAARAHARVQLLLGEDQQVLAFEPDLAGIDLAPLGRMPMTARIRVDLPQPDSPTTPRCGRARG
jgi:hypothetical protein